MSTIAQLLRTINLCAFCYHAINFGPVTHLRSTIHTIKPSAESVVVMLF